MSRMAEVKIILTDDYCSAFISTSLMETFCLRSTVKLGAVFTSLPLLLLCLMSEEMSVANCTFVSVMSILTYETKVEKFVVDGNS